MPDFTSCPQCHARYRTAGMPSGKKLRCKKCKAVFVVQADRSEERGAGSEEGEQRSAGGRSDAAVASDSEHALPAALGDHLETQVPQGLLDRLEEGLAKLV
jgi:hypothetical protein